MEATTTGQSTTCWRCGDTIVIPTPAKWAEFSPEVKARWAKPPRMECRSCYDEEEARIREAERAARAGNPFSWKPADVARDTEGALALIGVPDRLRAADWTNCMDIPDELVRRVKSWSADPHGSLLLTGRAGSGKTWLSVAALRNIVLGSEVELGDCIFTTEARYLEKLKLSFGAAQVPARVLQRNHPRRARVLVLDDLGAARATDWAIEQIGQLIGDRYAENLPTIITSNLSLGELAKVDARIASRIGDGGNVLLFPDRDLRLAGRK